MKRGGSLTLLAAGVVCLSVVLSHGSADSKTGANANWPSWRGPSGQGYVNGSNVPLTWSETKNLLWKTDLPGRGNSSPIVWGDHIFLTAASPNGDERYVLCVQATDGKILWKQLASKGAGPGKTHEWNGYASASCVTDGSRVYAFFGTPGLFCYDFQGNLVWKHDFGIFTSERGWGTAASPFLFEDLVIQNCDNDGPQALPPGHKPEEAAPMALVALDKKTGEVRWQAERNQGRGFSTPVLLTTAEGRLDLVLNGPRGVWAYEPRSGKELWHCDRKAAGDWENNSARFGEPLPVSNHDMLFAASGRPGPFQAIRLGGVGDVSQSNLVWEVVRQGHRDVSSPILWQDLSYAVDSKGFLTCHEAKTGAVVYNVRIGDRALASPVEIGEKLLFVLDDGTALVIQPGREFKVLHKNHLGEGKALDFAASPAVASGRLYLRSQSSLYCIGEKK
jgi:outer membrane protein assembly factor BamB